MLVFGLCDLLLDLQVATSVCFVRAEISKLMMVTGVIRSPDNPLELPRKTDLGGSTLTTRPWSVRPSRLLVVGRWVADRRFRGRVRPDLNSGPPFVGPF